jgi:hypothetical protein
MIFFFIAFFSLMIHKEFTIQLKNYLVWTIN